MYNYVIQTNHTKEDAINDKLELRKLLIYTQSVYQIQKKIKELTDKRKRKQIPFFNLIMPVFVFLLLQYESFHTIFSAPESMGKRLRNCIRGKTSKVDAVRDTLARVEVKEVEKIFDSVVAKTYRNVVLRGGTIGGYVTMAVDGVELFSSTRKSCRNCLSRKSGAEGKEFFHRSVVCATIGEKNGKESVGWMRLVTTSEEIPYEILWKMMHKRWDIEENAFHQLKTYYHAKHCYCHEGLEVVFNPMLIAFNIREMYLYRRIHSFEKSRITRKSVSRIFRDNLQAEDLRGYLYIRDG